MSEEKKLTEALLKKAIGYTAKEEVVEYKLEDGETYPVKKKISKKHYPPDLSAMKAYMELAKSDGLINYTNEELLLEKSRLLVELANSTTSNTSNNTTNNQGEKSE